MPLATTGVTAPRVDVGPQAAAVPQAKTACPVFLVDLEQRERVETLVSLATTGTTEATENLEELDHVDQVDLP